MKRYLIFLSVLLWLSVGCHAASPSFSSFYTNHFTTNNLIIKANLNPLQFDTNASTVTITITNVSGTPGSSLWTNKGGLGVIQPLSGQVTNALLFISGSAAAATNTLLTLDTANTWTDQNTKLIDLRHSGTNVAYVTPYGSFESGKGVAWASPSSDDLFLGVHDTSLGESDYALIYSAAIDGSSPTNYSEFSATLNTGASPAGVLNLASLTNGVSSYFQVTVQPDQSVARIELQSQGQRMFYVEDQTGYAGGGNKMLGDDGKYHDGLVLWTNIANVLQPLVGFDVLVTNLSSTHSLIANGSFHISGLSASNLVANTNNLNPYQVGTFQLTGPTATASDTRIQLGTGIGYQLLTIENLSTNSAFNMRNGEPQWDDASSYVRLRGDWSTTNQGDTLLLYHNGFFWSEINRSFANTNVVAPSVINPTDNYIPVRQSAGVFADSPLHIPSAGDTNVIANGALYVGQNSYSLFGDTDLALVQYRSVQNGDADLGGIAIYTQMTNGQAFASVDIAVRTNSAQIGTLWNDGVLSGRQITFLTDSTDTQFSMSDVNGVVRTLFQPSETSSTSASIANFVDTDNTWTQGYLLGVRNNGTNMLSVGHLGQLTFGPGITNLLYRNGTSLVYQNGYVGGTTNEMFALRNGTTNRYVFMSDFPVTGGNGIKIYGQNGTANVVFGAKSDGIDAHVTAAAGGAVWFSPANASSGSYALTTAGFLPDTDGKNVGSIANAWRDLSADGTHYIYGHRSGTGYTNYARLATSHTGTNGVVNFDSQSANDAGGPRSINFQIGSTNVARIDRSASAGETRFWLYDEDNGTMERVTVGAADSGGVGYKLLRIPN